MMDAKTLNRKLDRLAAKRDCAADEMQNPLLAWTYQKEINKLVAEYGHLLSGDDDDRAGEPSYDELDAILGRD